VDLLPVREMESLPAQVLERLRQRKRKKKPTSTETGETDSQI